MRIVWTLLLCGVGFFAAGCSSAETAPDPERIAQAVIPLPEDLRADATVFEYDPDTGERIVLRAGSNQVECMPKNDEGFTRCFPVTTAARRDFSAKLEAEGLKGDALTERMNAAQEAGEIPPVPFGSLSYRAYGEDDRIRLLWMISLPNATSEELAMPTASQRDASLAGYGTPWMMLEGTPGAHLMIPINGAELSNAGDAGSRLDTKAITDPLVQAVLPLPEEFRDAATVIEYDPATGQRTVLREGTNGIVCQPRNPETGFTRCYHESTLPELDLNAKLHAQGLSDDEIDAAVIAAREEGTVNPVTFGSLYYRLYEDDDRLKLLWVLRLPNAMPEELGMSTASQRDQSLEGRGLPWMMRVGTPAAHLMIPINHTELSN